MITPEPLTWALARARQQTLLLTADIPAEDAWMQDAPGEHHPIWTLGHLVLADSYLLELLGAEPLPSDFTALLRRYGPGAVPVASPSACDSLPLLVERLITLDARRQAALAGLTPTDMAGPVPDPALARAQPSLAHHVHAMVHHEGYHAGQLTAWRRRRGLPSTTWAFAHPGLGVT